MNDFQTRVSDKKSFKHSWFFLVILLIVLFLFARSAYASFTKKRNADIERNKYEEQLQKIIDKKHELENRINNLKTERGIEEELRKRFNIVKEGETMVRVIDEPS